jgi:integrase
MISERLGHTDTRITLNLYTHALPEQDIEAAEVMAAMLIKKKD